MPPKKMIAVWGEDQVKALLKGFRELQWDPEETEGRKINALLKKLPDNDFSKIQFWFSRAQGGTKADNN